MQNGPQIDLSEDVIAPSYRQAKQKRGPGPWWLLGILLVVSILIAYRLMGWGDSTKNSSSPAPQSGMATSDPRASREHAAEPNSVPVPQPSQGKESGAGDDDRWLWVSPTQGEPLDLYYLPAGTQLLVHFRPESLWAHPEGEKIVAALGPWIKRVLASFQPWYPGPWNEVPTVMLAVSSGVQSELHYVLRFELASQWSDNLLKERLGRYERGPCELSRHQGQTYFVAAGLAFWLPPDSAGSILVVCLPADMPELIEGGHEPIGLPRDVQRLVASTDRQQIFTALLLVEFLQRVGQKLLSRDSDLGQELSSALTWLWGKEATAAALSLHWDRDFFVELQAVATLNVRPHHFARQLGERISELPDRCQRYLHTQRMEPYGRQVLARFPGMLRQLKIYTRSGSEQGFAVFRCYLPVQAGHNLLLAGELCLSAAGIEDRPGADGYGADGQTAVAHRGATTDEKLASITSLVLPKDTLEQALQLLAEDIGVEIEILGRDLQLAGITKNQSFGIDLRDQPASNILLEILRRANPDRTATGPADSRQMLVYMIRRGEDGSLRILITTRTAAAVRGDALPEVFQPRPQ